MTITLYLQKETLQRDLQTLQHLFRMDIDLIQGFKKHYEPLNISSSEFTKGNVSIQVTPEEFDLIGVFNGSI